MTRIYLIRHAEAEGNLYRRGQGQYDSLVTDRGYQQIEALSRRFRDIPVDAVYSSDLFRTMKTASAVYESHGLPLHTDPGLREVAMGVWENTPWGEIARAYKEQLHYFNTNSALWHVEGSETFAQLRDRLAGTLDKIAKRHDGQTIVVTSHGMAIRNLLAVLQGMSVEEGNQVPHSDNTGVSLVEYENGRAKVLMLGDNSHLTEELSTFAGQKWWKSGSGFWEDANLWYAPLDPVAQGDYYLACYREAWETVHGDTEGFDGDYFLAEARAHAAKDPRVLWVPMLREEQIGLLQLDVTAARSKKVGYYSLVYLKPEFRRRGLGVQLIGQGVSVFRALGCRTARLRCAPENREAQRFYARYGFHKIGEEAGSRGPLDILEKNIGFDEI